VDIMAASIVPTFEELTAEQYAVLLGQLRGLQAQVQAPPLAAPVLLKPPKPEPFKGGRKVASWLFSIEQYFAVVGVADDTARIAYAATLLRDTAADWWRGFNIAAQAGRKALPSTWTEFKTAITAHFQPIHEEDFARQYIRTLRQHRSVRDYVVRFQEVSLQIPTMDERSRVDAFTAGLKQDVRRWVKLQAPSTLERAMEIAEQYQTMMMQDMAAMRASADRPRFENSGGGGDGPVPMDVDSRANNLRAGKHKSKKPSSKEKGGRKEDKKVMTCWHCNQPGHLRRNCPSLKGSTTKIFKASAQPDSDGSTSESENI
jgi:Retrotransposon gag protein/Zinc knuckle